MVEVVVLVVLVVVVLVVVLVVVAAALGEETEMLVTRDLNLTHSQYMPLTHSSTHS